MRESKGNEEAGKKEVTQVRQRIRTCLAGCRRRLVNSFDFKFSPVPTLPKTTSMLRPTDLTFTSRSSPMPGGRATKATRLGRTAGMDGGLQRKASKERKCISLCSQTRSTFKHPASVPGHSLAWASLPEKHTLIYGDTSKNHAKFVASRSLNMKCEICSQPNLQVKGNLGGGGEGEPTQFETEAVLHVYLL